MSVESKNIESDAAVPSRSLLSCPNCDRKTPQTRQTCLYCGSVLPISDEGFSRALPASRELEAWESGFNLILVNAASIDRSRSSAILGLDKDTIDLFADCIAPVPIARVETADMSESLRQDLECVGMSCQIVADTDLNLREPNKRLSAIEFSVDHVVLIAFNTGERIIRRNEEISAVVPGVLSRTRVDSLSKRKRGGGSASLSDLTTSDDTAVMDIYSRIDPIGFRVLPSGFDFSCLGDERGFLASQNWGKLLKTIAERLPAVRLAADYASLRPVLEIVWPAEIKNESKGLVPTGFGKREFGTTSTINNDEQFLRFSRLQANLL